MYDYLSAVTPDYNSYFSVSPQEVLTEEGYKKQEIHIGDDGSEERISYSSASIFYIIMKWNGLSKADADTIVDFYHSESKGNGMARTFLFSHPTDGHTYVIRFDSMLPRTISAIHSFNNIKFRVVGRVNDA